MLCTAFEGFSRIATGELREVAMKAKEVLDRGEKAPILIFDNVSSEMIEVDFRGNVADVVCRLAETERKGGTEAISATDNAVAGAVAKGPGRPKLGVVSREVTLLPRHWDWLNSQPGGASVALRKLVEEARRANEKKDRVRMAQDATYRFLYAIAGNLPDFEEVIRALFALDGGRFNQLVEPWPKDVREHAQMLMAATSIA